MDMYMYRGRVPVRTPSPSTCSHESTRASTLLYVSRAHSHAQVRSEAKASAEYKAAARLHAAEERHAKALAAAEEAARRLGAKKLEEAVAHGKREAERAERLTANAEKHVQHRESPMESPPPGRNSRRSPSPTRLG